MNNSILRLNLVVGALFIVGYWVEKLTGIPWLRSLAALPIVFFLPGWNISFLLFPQLLSPLERIVFGLIISFPAFAAAIYYTHLLRGLALSETLVLTVTAVLSGVSLSGGLLGVRFFGQPRQEESRRELPLLIAAVLLSITMAAAIFLIYPFIPEADPYTFIALAQKVLSEGQFSLPGYRSLFVTLTSALSILGHVPLEVIFKIILPLFGVTMLLPLFLTARQFLKERSAIFVATILPLATPAVMLESVTTRPQVAILFTLPGLLYFLVQSLRRRAPWLAGVILAASLLLFKFHELALLLIPPAAITLVILLWPEVKKQPKLSVAFGALGTLALYPYFASSDLVAVVRGIESLVWERVFLAPPRLWFLSQYTNVDGVVVGWPGWTALYYYAYSIGPIVPLLFAGLLFRKKKVPLRLFSHLWPVAIALAIFLTIAEVLPRFHVGYFPDRIWPFLILSLALLTPALLVPLEHLFSRRAVQLVTALALALGISGALYLTWAKQGWVTRKEYEAAEFLRRSSPEESAVISQGGNAPLISYYADRLFINVDIFSPSVPTETMTDTLKKVPAILSSKQALADEKQAIAEKLVASSVMVKEGREGGIATLEGAWRTLLPRLVAIEAALERIDRLDLDRPRPVYVLYSKDKFTYLYGIRSWWRTLNYADADLTRFEDAEQFERVFDNGLVKVWKVKNVP